jgi:hypothetical protein
MPLGRVDSVDKVFPLSMQGSAQHSIIEPAQHSGAVLTSILPSEVTVDSNLFCRNKQDCENEVEECRPAGLGIYFDILPSISMLGLEFIHF